MIDDGLSGVEFVVINTDIQDLNKNKADERIQIGCKLTSGKGAGGKPETGEKAAQEDRESIAKAVEGADMVFVTAGMGGGTGTGSAPVIAKIAKEKDILTIGVVTTPFAYEGKLKASRAAAGIEKMRAAVDALIIVPNEALMAKEEDLALVNAYQEADSVLQQGVRGISELITKPGIVNVDFADVVSTMKAQGEALMGIGTARGGNRAMSAASAAISNVMLKDRSMKGATHILVNITCDETIKLSEVNTIMNLLKEGADENADIIHGICLDDKMAGEIRVTVIATGFQDKTAGSGMVIPHSHWEAYKDRSKGPLGYLSRRSSNDELEVPSLYRNNQFDFDGEDEKKSPSGNKNQGS
jgi:cell division protein FtsZ